MQPCPRQCAEDTGFDHFLFEKQEGTWCFTEATGHFTAATKKSSTKEACRWTFNVNVRMGREAPGRGSQAGTKKNTSKKSDTFMKRAIPAIFTSHSNSEVASVWRAGARHRPFDRNGVISPCWTSDNSDTSSHAQLKAFCIV